MDRRPTGSAPAERRLRLRPGGPDDEAAVLRLATRLSDFPVPSWRTAEEISRGDDQVLREQLWAPRTDGLLLIAEYDPQAPVGMILVTTRIDYFRQDQIAHVEVLVVDSAHERQGIAGMLMAAAEEWARARGVERMGLTVWEANQRARRFYDRNGYRAETIHYLKEL
ncbi:MAG: GNAT family N-acetyltransferase [Gemmatimonadetes bacterium]|nr:GNAT family N-acetyltransferase [Gemmatimonadota bacterium]